MNNAIYEVVYIDKLQGKRDAPYLRERIRRRFDLSEAGLERLCSGSPVVVKSRLSLAEAQRYCDAIKRVGGDCWIQPLDENGRHWERRCRRRRSLLDRRTHYRGSSILPDRRGNCGRRSNDRPG